VAREPADLGIAAKVIVSSPKRRVRFKAGRNTVTQSCSRFSSNSGRLKNTLSV
jgi:hypothetical protein